MEMEIAWRRSNAPQYLETIMEYVLLAAAGFLLLAYEAADLKGNEGYQIAAEFGRTGGLSIGDDVRVSGSRRRITGQQLDPTTYVARYSCH